MPMKTAPLIIHTDMHSAQLEISEWLRDQGLKQVLKHTPESWVDAFEGRACDLLFAHGSFTAEEVVAFIGLPPNHINAVGAVCRTYAKRNKLVGSYEKATNPAAHARAIMRWREDKQ